MKNCVSRKIGVGPSYLIYFEEFRAIITANFSLRGAFLGSKMSV